MQDCGSLFEDHPIFIIQDFLTLWLVWLEEYLSENLLKRNVRRMSKKFWSVNYKYLTKIYKFLKSIYNVKVTGFIFWEYTLLICTKLANEFFFSIFLLTRFCTQQKCDFIQNLTLPFHYRKHNDIKNNPYSISRANNYTSYLQPYLLIINKYIIFTDTWIYFYKSGRVTHEISENVCCVQFW